MTMPDKPITATLAVWGRAGPVEVIEKSVAVELARALEFMLRGPVRTSPMAVQDCERTLAKYDVITKDGPPV